MIEIEDDPMITHIHLWDASGARSQIISAVKFIARPVTLATEVISRDRRDVVNSLQACRGYHGEPASASRLGVASRGFLFRRSRHLQVRSQEHCGD